MTDQSTEPSGRETGGPVHLVTEVYVPVTPSTSAASATDVNLNNMDIETAVTTMMVLLNDDAESDIRAILTEMQKTQAAKQKLRSLLSQVMSERKQIQGQSPYDALVDEAQQAIQDRLDSPERDVGIDLNVSADGYGPALKVLRNTEQHYEEDQRHE
jgi:hypothetical protein